MAQTLYRGMDRAEIDRQFNLRARWPDHPVYFARWAADSAAIRERRPGKLNLAYGDAPGETLDLFLPEPAPAVPPPLLAFIHGGYWQAFDKNDFTFLAPPFQQAGFAVALLNYDLAPKVGIGDMVVQIRRACLWLADSGGAHGYDGDRVYLAGHSAGGHLATMGLITDWAALTGRAGAEPVKGACSISGIYELEPLRHSYQQDVLRLDEATVRDASPLRHVPWRAGPLILAVGGGETEEFLRQQAELLAAWRAARLPVQVVDLPGRDHFAAVEALGEPGNPLHSAICAMLRGGPA